MSGTSITIDQNQLLITLGSLQASVADRSAILRIVGAYMLGSVQTTYREEGFPAGSWPELAESTKRNKAYTAGHKLLVMSGRLFDSLIAAFSSDSVSIGTGVNYARVQFYGSADRQGSQAGGGPKLNRDHVHVSAYDALRVVKFRGYGNDARTDKNGKTRNLRVRAQGADNASRYKVGEHDRHQNIPARNPLVFRPEDPANLVIAVNNYFRATSKAVIA